MASLSTSSSSRLPTTYSAPSTATADECRDENEPACSVLLRLPAATAVAVSLFLFLFSLLEEGGAAAAAAAAVVVFAVVVGAIRSSTRTRAAPAATSWGIRRLPR